MKAVVQRVKQANVKVDEKVVGSINKGLVILLGVGNDDTIEKVDYLVKKITSLRIFTDEAGKMNLSLKDVNGEILVVSQFTLFADCSRGNRPSFSTAGKPELAKELYEYFIEECKKLGIKTETGIFAAHMQVTLTNDGPVTIILEN